LVCGDYTDSAGAFEGFFFQFDASAFEECFDHLSDAFLHFSTDSALADKNRKTMKFHRMFATKFNVLHDPDQNLVATFFKSGRVPEVVFRFRAG